MIVKDIYIAVSAYTDVDQFKFLVCFNETINEINLMYPLMDALKNAPDINYEWVYPEMYFSPIIDNILYLLGLGDRHKSEFLRKMKFIFCAWWKSKRLKTGFIKRSEH